MSLVIEHFDRRIDEIEAQMDALNSERAYLLALRREAVADSQMADYGRTSIEIQTGVKL